MAKRSRPKNSRACSALAEPTAVHVDHVALDLSALHISAPNEDAKSNNPAVGKAAAQDSSIQSIPVEKALQTGTSPGTAASRTDGTVAFRLLDLPVELRTMIYAHHFAGADDVLDLSPDNFHKVHKSFAIFRTCRTVYAEASCFFYSSRTFRVFPTYPGRFFKTRRPLLARLSPKQRAEITALELRLGPGFNKPPKCWVVNPILGLKDCVRVRKLAVFVQIDPSLSWLDGFRQAGFYEAFSANLMDKILSAVPSIKAVEFDAYESVRKNCAMMEGLIKTALDHEKKLAWGPTNSWSRKESELQPSSITTTTMPTTGTWKEIEYMISS